MNKYLKIIVFALAGFMLNSCADDELSPIITFDKADKGAYVRLINQEEAKSFYDLTNISSAEIAYDVEFVDLEDGALVTNYSVNVEYVDKNPANGDNSVPVTPYLSMDKASFGTSVNGNVGTSISIPLSDLASKLNLNTDDIKALDVFNFTASITLESGAVFTGANSSAAVNGSAFQGHFIFSGNVTCPVPTAVFVGAYTLDYVGVAPTLFGGKPYGDLPMTVTLSTISGSVTGRAIDGMTGLGDLGIGNGPMTQNIDLLCDQTVPLNSSAGLFCVDDILIGQGSQPNGTFDLTDDSSFTLNLELDVTDDCGAGPVPFSVTLTKQ